MTGGRGELYLQHREPIADQDIFERHSRKNHEYFIKMENIRDSPEIKTDECIYENR